MSNSPAILYSDTAGKVPSSLVAGQIAINRADQKLFTLDSGGNIIVFYLLNANGLAALAAILPTTDPGIQNQPWLNGSFLAFSQTG